MKTEMLRRGRAVLVGITLLTGLIAAPALAQFPGGGGGGPQGRFPFAFGTISAVDSGAGTVTLASQFGNNASQKIKVGSGVQIITLTTIAVTDLKVGDKIAVQGVPTGITASAITAGDPPTGLPGLGGGPRGGNRGGNNAAGTNAGGTNVAGTAAAQSSATATGTIKVLPTAADPHLTLTLGTDVQLFLKVADGAKVTKYTTLQLTDLKSGDRIIAGGQTGNDGTLTATSVGVNMPQQGGFGGPGGPGDFGGGRGGFGGGRGPQAREQQGNPDGGPGGFGGPGGPGGFGGPGGPGGFGGPGGGPGWPDGGGPDGPPPDAPPPGQ